MPRKGSKDDQQRAKIERRALQRMKERDLESQMQDHEKGDVQQMRHNGGDAMSNNNNGSSVEVAAAVKEVVGLQQKYHQGRSEGRFANGEIPTFSEDELIEMYNARRVEFDAHRKCLIDAIEGQQKEAMERDKLLNQIVSFRKTIDSAKEQGFRTVYILADENEINGSSLEILKLHVENFSKVAENADAFLKGRKIVPSAERASTLAPPTPTSPPPPPEPTATLTDSQKRLIAADDPYLWRVLTIPRDKIIKEANWPELAQDCQTAFELIKSSEEGLTLTPELKQLRERITRQAVIVTERLVKMRRLADEKGVSYTKTPYTDMKPWEQHAQARQLKFELKKLEKEEKMNPGTKALIEKRQEQYTEAGKTAAVIDLTRATEDEAQKWLSQHPEIIPSTPAPTPKPQVQEKSFGELFAPIIERLDNELTKSVDAASRRNEGGGQPIVINVPPATSQSQLTADTLADALRQRGIGVLPPTGGESRDDDHNGHRDGWGKKVVWLLALILALLAFGGMLYLFGAFNSVKDTAESAMRLATTANETAKEAKSLAQSAQATANQAQTTANRAIEHDKVQDGRLAQLESDVAKLKSSLDSFASRLQSLDRRLSDFQMQVNNEVAKLLLEVKLLGERTDNLEVFVNEIRPQMARLETELRSVNAFVALNSFAQFFCFFLCGHTMREEQVRYESPIPPPSHRDHPVLRDAPPSCSSGLTSTNQGTYLVGLNKVWESSDQVAIRLLSPATCFGQIILVHFDSIYPDQGRQVNQNGPCWIDDHSGLVICQKIAGFRLRNIKTTYNGVETWGLVEGGTIPIP